MAAKRQDQHVFAILSDLPHDISENYVEGEISMKARQQGFKYYSENYFERVKLYKSDKENEVRISAKCHRSQRKNESPHSINLDVSSGSLGLAHCSCTAGASGSCSHIIGLLMALQHWILMGFKAVPDNLTCTSMPQQWSVPRGSKIESSAAPQICIIKPHPDRKQKPVENVLRECRKIYVNGEDVDHLKALKGLPISYLVSNPMKRKMTHLGEVGIGSGLSTHASFYEPQVQKAVDTKCGDLKLPYICPVLLPDKYKNLSESLAIDLNKAHEIQEETQEQYHSQRWHLERKTRLTASKFYEILHRKTISLKYVKSILEPKAFKSTSTSYGISNEKKAREMYVKRQGLHVHDCGLCINPELPFIGATPDGIVCDGGVSGIIEIKCPYSARDLTIQESLSLPNFCLLETDGKITLKKSHAFYFQVQGQLLVTGVSFCDFIVFTRKELHVERIYPNVHFMKELVSNLTEIYFCHFHDFIE